MERRVQITPIRLCMNDTTNDNPTRADIISEVARLWAEGIAEQDARTPEEAAKAAGRPLVPVADDVA